MGGNTRPLRHCHVHQRSQTCSQINGLQMGFSRPTKFPGNPPKRNEGTRVYTIMCNTLPQNAGHSADQCISESKKELSSYLTQKSKETHSQTQSKACHLVADKEESYTVFTSEDWRSLFVHYLTEGILPQKHSKKYKLKKLAVRYFLHKDILF